MSRDDAVLLDIRRAAERAASALEGKDFPDLADDWQLQSAVIHQLMLVGEAAKRLSLEYRTRNSEIPWADWAGMRDVLIHQYDDVDVAEVWNTVMRDIPALLAFLRPRTSDFH